ERVVVATELEPAAAASTNRKDRVESRAFRRKCETAGVWCRPGEAGVGREVTAAARRERARSARRRRHERAPERSAEIGRRAIVDERGARSERCAARGCRATAARRSALRIGSAL